MAFEFDGEKYAKAARPQREWGGDLIGGLSLRGDEAVLDLGCGDGALTQRLARLVPNGRALGVDASEGMIRAAEKRAGGNLSFVRMDILDIGFREQFDLIFSNAALHWVKAHDRVLRRAREALLPGGRLAWEFGCEGNCANLIATVRAQMARPEFRPRFEGFEWPWYMPAPADYARLAAENGFPEAEISEQNRDRRFASAEEMIRWIDQPCIVPFLARLPEAERPAFRQAVVDQMLDRTREADGTYFETFRRIRVLAARRETGRGGFS